MANESILDASYSAQFFGIDLLDLLPLLVGSVTEDVDDLLLVSAPALHGGSQCISIGQRIKLRQWTHSWHFLTFNN